MLLIQLRAKGIKAGVISPNILRPFPQKQIAEALKNVKAITIGDRGDSYGAHGGNMALEVRAALQTYGNTEIKVINRIYGLGGKDFYADEAEQFFQLAIDAVEAGKVEVPFDYFGHTPGNPELAPKRRVEPLKKEDLNTGLITVTPNEETGRIKS